nr:uncharacterized protein LOC106686812 [Halyomorpha halys]
MFSLLFVDDQAVVTYSREGLEEELKALKKEYSLCGIQINFDKTEYLPVNCKEYADLRINGCECKKVDSFKYMRSTIDGNSESEPEVRRRAGMTRRLTRMLHPVLWNTVISTDNKRQIFRSIVEYSLNYAAETWALNPGLQTTCGRDGFLEEMPKDYPAGEDWKEQTAMI